MIGVLRSLRLDARDHGKVSRDGCKICMLPRCVDKAKGVNCQLSVYCPIDSVSWCSTILSCLALLVDLGSHSDGGSGTCANGPRTGNVSR